MDEKTELARRLYVEEGRPLPDIGMSLDMSISALRAHAIANKWDEAREVFLAAKRRAVDEDDLGAQHEFALNAIKLEMAEVQAKFKREREMDGYSSVDARKWRDTIESLQREHQIVVEHIKAQRLVRGIKPNAPSSTPDVDTESGVRFVVKIEREVKSETGSA